MTTAAFHEVRFPIGISYGASGGPGFNTTVLTLASGYERRNMNWSVARGTWDVAHGLKTQAELNQLIAFFYARRGKAYGFRFKDWMDYQLPFPGGTAPVLFTTNGTASTFQIQKTYGDAGASYVRKLTKIVAGTLTVYSNGLVTTDYSVDITTGIVTLGASLRSVSGRQISASCEFDVPVRFDTDQMKPSLDDYDNASWGQIPVVELRL